MSYNRRRFIKSVGVTLASLIVSRALPACTSSTTSDTAQPPATPTTNVARATCIPSTIDDTAQPHPARERLRDCWLRLDWLAQETRESWGSDAQGEQTREQLASDHQVALDELVAVGELDAAVAGRVQLAFGAAAYHVWRSNTLSNCYDSMTVDYTPTSADQLVQQADLLAEMADKGDLDPDTVARVQAVIQRDMAFLSLSQAETRALYDALYEAAGDTHDFPSLEELALEIAPAAVEAACFLAQLLLEG